VGGIIVETDMRDINAAIERSQKEDIDLVYESLVCGSRNHLRSYAENIVKTTGVSYVAQVISQASGSNTPNADGKVRQIKIFFPDICNGKIRQLFAPGNMQAFPAFNY
jgi:hypothetical protein